MPGAYRDEAGVWSIGVEDLLAAGFRVDAPAPPEQAPEGLSRGPAETIAGGAAGHVDAAELRLRVAELEAEARERAAELADARRRAEVAEAIANERAAQIGDLRRTIAALEAGASDRGPVPPPPVPQPVPAATSPRRGLFGRIVEAVAGG